MLAELPPFAARFAFQLRLVASTFCPLADQFAFQPEDSVSPLLGKLNVSDQPSIGLGPVSVTVSEAT
jgi:hypothetical protein